MSPQTSWLSEDRLPIVLYFGSVIAMSSVYCAFRYFGRNKRSSVNIEKKQSASDATATSSNGHVNRFRNTCRAVFAFVGTKPKFKFSKYFVNSKTKESSEASKSPRADKGINGHKNETHGKLALKSKDNRLSKVNHLSVDEEFLEKQQSRLHSMNEEEASLTQIVIAQIEHDYNERNKKTIESHSGKSPRNVNVKSSLDTHQSNNKNGGQAAANERRIDAAQAAKNTEQEIKGKLSVQLGLPEADRADEDPIYDVPPSKSLINLSASADEEINLQKQHHIQVHDLAYFHTSSPNIFLTVEQEESIYDTPSTRSLAI